MIDFQEESNTLRRNKDIIGQKPLYLIIQKGVHPYKGKYLVTINNDRLNFYELKNNWKLNKKNGDNFYIRISDIANYHFAYHKEFFKRISFRISNDIDLTIIFPLGNEWSYGNEDNALAIMKYLKENGVKQTNEIKGKNDGPKEIKKVDQYFVKEIRAPEKRKGLFRR